MSQRFNPGAAGNLPSAFVGPADDPVRRGPVLTVPGAPLAFHVMAKPTGAVCNLDCEYCFFLSKEMLYPGSRFRMAADLQETYIRQLLEAHSRVPEVVVAWQGGEQLGDFPQAFTHLSLINAALNLDQQLDLRKARSAA